MEPIAEQRFINAHGQPFARLDNTDSIYPDADGHKITWFFQTINLMLLHAPFSFLTDLHAVSVDDIILEYAWRRYFRRLLDDWDRLVLQVRRQRLLHCLYCLMFIAPQGCRCLDCQRVLPRHPRCHPLSRPAKWDRWRLECAVLGEARVHVECFTFVHQHSIVAGKCYER